MGTATVAAPVGATPASQLPAPAESKPDAPPPAPPPPGGPATAGFFTVIDQIRSFLAAEAVADGWVGKQGDGAGAAHAGADGLARVASGAGNPSSRPPPDWDWVAGQLLPLLQQYSGTGREVGGGRGERTHKNTRRPPPTSCPHLFDLDPLRPLHHFPSLSPLLQPASASPSSAPPSGRSGACW